MIKEFDAELDFSTVAGAAYDQKKAAKEARKYESLRKKALSRLMKDLQAMNETCYPCFYRTIGKGKDRVCIATTPFVRENTVFGGDNPLAAVDVTYIGVSENGFCKVSFADLMVQVSEIGVVKDASLQPNSDTRQKNGDVMNDLLVFHESLRNEDLDIKITSERKNLAYGIDIPGALDSNRPTTWYEIKPLDTQIALNALQQIQIEVRDQMNRISENLHSEAQQILGYTQHTKAK